MYKTDYSECKKPGCSICMSASLHGLVRALENLKLWDCIDYSRMSFSHSDILELQLNRAKKLLAKAEGAE